MAGCPCCWPYDSLTKRYGVFLGGAAVSRGFGDEENGERGMAMAAQDAYERQRVNVAVAWAVAASLCVAFAVFGFDGVMRGRAASTDSAVFQGLVSGLIGVDASAKDAVTVSAVVFNAFTATVLALLSYYAAHVTVRTDWHRSVDYAGSLATVVAAAIAAGPALARIAQIMSVTRSAALAVFLSATLVAVMAAYIQYAASGRITVALARLLITAAVIIALFIIAVVIFAIPAPVIAAACSVGGAWYVHAQANVILRVPVRYLLSMLSRNRSRRIRFCRILFSHIRFSRPNPILSLPPVRFPMSQAAMVRNRVIPHNSIRHNPMVGISPARAGMHGKP